MKENQHIFIQNALIAAINDSSYTFPLPVLKESTWRTLNRSPATADELERLEFVGDALMHACVALELYRHFPLGSPSMYTVSFSTMHSRRGMLQRFLVISAHSISPEYQCNFYPFHGTVWTLQRGSFRQIENGCGRLRSHGRSLLF